MQILFNDIPGVKTTFELLPYEQETNGNVTYIRYTDGKHLTQLRGKVMSEEAVLILRKTIDGNTTRWEKAHALWANRTTATYVPINSPFDMFRTWQ